MNDIFKEFSCFVLQDFGIQNSQHLDKVSSVQVQLCCNRHCGILGDVQLIHFNDLLELETKLCNGWDLTGSDVCDWQRAALDQALIEGLHSILLLLEVHSTLIFDSLILFHLGRDTLEVGIGLSFFRVVLVEHQTTVPGYGIHCSAAVWNELVIYIYKI